MNNILIQGIKSRARSVFARVYEIVWNNRGQLGMGNTLDKIRGTKEQSAEDIKNTRLARQEYNDYLNKLGINITADVKNNKLTPESGQQILLKIKESQKWLSDNPNANLNEILANKETTIIEMNRIITTDKPKLQLKNMLIALPTAIQALKLNKEITTEQEKQLKVVIETTDKWLATNGSTETSIGFSQEEMKFKDSIRDILVNKEKVDRVFSELDKVKDQPIGTVESDMLKEQEKLKMIESQTVDVKQGINTAVGVILNILFISIFIVAGSLAANMAIGRTVPYRILYFIYGAVPVIAPFVLIYSLYKRIRYGLLNYFSLLPLIPYTGDTKILFYLLSPIHYIPSPIELEQQQRWTASLTSMKA